MHISASAEIWQEVKVCIEFGFEFYRSHINRWGLCPCYFQMPLKFKMAWVAGFCNPCIQKPYIYWLAWNKLEKKPFLSPDGEMKTLEATFSGSHLFSTVLTRYGSFFSDQNVKKEQAKAAESLCCLSDISLLKWNIPQCFPLTEYIRWVIFCALPTLKIWLRFSIPL